MANKTDLERLLEAISIQGRQEEHWTDKEVARFRETKGKYIRQIDTDQPCNRFFLYNDGDDCVLIWMRVLKGKTKLTAVNAMDFDTIVIGEEV